MYYTTQWLGPKLVSCHTNNTGVGIGKSGTVARCLTNLFKSSNFTGDVFVEGDYKSGNSKGNTIYE